ncbi:MAG: mechanosensitive ion channel [Desulfobacterales bacterium]|nr:mechanosensitive ion channel [Desulfobacterales bacterium]
MQTPISRFTLALVSLLLVVVPLAALAADAESPPADEPAIGISEEMGEAMLRQATEVREDLTREARSLFEREPLGWDLRTLTTIYRWALDFPKHIAALVAMVIEHSRVLGVAGSLVMLIFIVAVLYSLIGQRRVLRRIERGMEPYRDNIPETVFPFVLSGLRILVAALIPLGLLAAYSLVNALVTYDEAWFVILGRLIILWAVGALVLNLLRESLARDLFEVTRQHGHSIYRLMRLVLLYTLAGIAIFWSAEALQLPADVLAFSQFVIALSIVVVLFLLHLKKTALLSFLPKFPYPFYQTFLRFLTRYYYLVIGVVLAAALLWCFGYVNLGRVVIVKIWSSGAAFVLIMVIYHAARTALQRRTRALSRHDEAGHALHRSLNSLLLYATILATASVVLNLLGLLAILRQVMSIPVLVMGGATITLWTIVSAFVILLAFFFASRLLRAYLDYRIYPRLGIDQGLGYVLNTLLNYSFLAIGFVIALRIVGLDLRFLLVFAGAVGIGIGLGLQSLAANIISGFSIIFGGKVRKGDWIEVGGTLGEVTDIYLGSAKIRTRDNVEYLIPNADLVTSTIVNYSLSSSFIRMDLSVGVGYDADPREVEKILLAVATAEPLVSDFRAPAVRFVEYGDNSINFELLFWIDVRTTARRRVRSALYFAIFEALKAAGIEIPFPQRDLHIRSGLPAPDPAPD